MLRNLFLMALLGLGLTQSGNLYAQSSDAVRAPLAEGYYWKDLPTIYSVIASEIQSTNTAISRQQFNKLKAILEAYRTLLNDFKLRLEKSENPAAAIESSFEFVKNEDVGVPYKRSLITNDIWIKKEELILKITTKQ